ncbi:hypothetical protein HZC32_03690 [Candidatus Woesearchaeota archaeon]|nr:hypothetical protein [Candidatus Woesearchaeota archaeon]
MRNGTRANSLRCSRGKKFDGKTKTAPGEKDENGRLIYLDPFSEKRVPDEKRVPRFNKDKGKFEIKQMGWEELEEEAHQMTLRAREIWEQWKGGKLSEEEFTKSNWAKFKDVKSKEDIVVRPEEAYIISTLETNAANSRGWATYYAGNFQENLENLKKLEKAKVFYKEIEKATAEEEKWKLKQQVRSLVGDLVPPEAKLPSEVIDHAIAEIRRHMEQAQEGGSSQWAQEAEAMETIKHVESAETYALKEAHNAYAQAGIQAMLKSQQLEGKGALRKPIFVAMENLFPESYGAHPDELIDLVKHSREQMEVILREKGMPANQAHEMAEKHIGATFDTGHFNMWKKYWRGDSHKPIEENDKEFTKWYLEQVEKLAKAGIVKHLHIVDNYGYQDEHLAPGQGNASIREAIEIFKKHGYKGEFIVEPGAGSNVDSNQFSFMTNAWKYFGRSIYGVGVEPKRWGEVQYSYFGQNQPPYFVFGPYAPSEDWTLWSGTPLE